MTSFLKHASMDGGSVNKPLILQSNGGKRKLVNMSIQRVNEASPRYVHVFQDCADLRTMEERWCNLNAWRRSAVRLADRP